MDAEYSTALYIHTQTSDPEIYCVAVNQTNAGRLVLRNGLSLGKLTTVVIDGLESEFPIILPLKGFQSFSQLDFTHITDPGETSYQKSAFAKREIIGMEQFPWQLTGLMTVLEEPEPVVILKPTIFISEISKTNAPTEGVALATINGTQLLVEQHPHSTYIVKKTPEKIAVYQLEVTVDQSFGKITPHFWPIWRSEFDKLFEFDQEPTLEPESATSDEEYLGQATLGKLRDAHGWGDED